MWAPDCRRKSCWARWTFTVLGPGLVVLTLTLFLALHAGSDHPECTPGYAEKVRGVCTQT
ncbi:hypothetical protein BJF85_02020 [Saccharomonospora sp. CUA-673]|nr:hypothetical protein BJF85_02020 [Saccharomonospora sp. CUA-673]